MKVLLLKEQKNDENGADPYIKELSLYGHTANLIPVLSFSFVFLDELSERLFNPDGYGGLIFTSPRAVEAVKISIESHKHKWDEVKEKWNSKSVYVVGKTTAALVVGLGLSPVGEDSGTAEKLSLFIIERELADVLPLFFPCGSIKREVLPTALRKNHIPMETLTVYQTSEHPDLQKNITEYYSQQGVPACVVFFSPSGVKFSVDLLKRLTVSHLDQIKFVSIGLTTADALKSHGLKVSCTAEKPTAKHLSKAISQILKTSES